MSRRAWAGRIRRRLRHLPAGLLVSGVLLVLAPALGAVWGGAVGAVGAALGVLVVAASYTVSSLVIAAADAVSPPLVLPVGLMAYALKFTVLAMAAIAAARTGWAGLPALGVAMAAAVLGWTGAQAWWTWHARIPYVQLDRD
jgi:hypothetical protein